MGKQKNIELPLPDLIKASMHNALDEYEIYVWNGEKEPVKKPIGEAITAISEDVRLVKTVVEEHKELLQGLKQKKDFIDSIMNVFGKSKLFLKLPKVWKIIAKTSAICIVLAGIYKFLELIKIIH